MLGALNHNNIVKLYCSYTYHSEHNLLFPRMEMDLEEFFTQKERLGKFQCNTTFYTALSGLTSALIYVHNFRLTQDEHRVDVIRIGYHHDIRPRNVLVNASTFLLTDFGLARMKNVEMGSQSIWKDINSDYIAPECLDIDLANQNVGRAVDIWAMGCLVIDTISYMMNGPSGRIEAQQRRLGDGPYPNFREAWFFAGKSLKRGVLSWVGELQESEDVRIRELLELSMSMLQVAPEVRLNAVDAHCRLSRIATKSLLHLAKQRVRVFDSSETGIYLEKQLDQWDKDFDVTGVESEAHPDVFVNGNGKFESSCQTQLQSIIQLLETKIVRNTHENPIAYQKQQYEQAEQLQYMIQGLWYPQYYRESDTSMGRSESRIPFMATSQSNWGSSAVDISPIIGSRSEPDTSNTRTISYPPVPDPIMPISPTYTTKPSPQLDSLPDPIMSNNAMQATM